jgi:hypothetical protein
MAIVAATIFTALLPLNASGQGIRPANPKASEEARKVLALLHDLPNS